MKKYLLFPLCAALCLLAGCADDFPTELNHNYYQDDTPPAEPDITEQTVKLGTYNLWISNIPSFLRRLLLWSLRWRRWAERRQNW